MAKAKLLWTFAKFTKWRDEDFRAKDSPFTIGILGENPFGKEILETLKTATVNKRRVEIRLCKSVDEAEACQVLFICASEKRNIATVLKALKTRHILTISEVDGFIEEGGIINMLRKQTGLDSYDAVPEINEEAVKKNWEFHPQLFAGIKNLKDQYK